MSYDNFIFIFDAQNKIGGFWKGEFAEEFDEIFAKEIIEKIIKKFGDLDFRIFDTLDPKNEEDNNNKILKIEILKRLPNKTLWKFKRRISSLFVSKKIRSKIGEFRTFDSSWKWRRDLLNLENISKLSITNILIMFITIIFIYNIGILQLYDGTLSFLFIIFLLLALTIVNLIFVLFPMRFPGVIKKIINLEDKEHEEEEVQTRKIEEIKVIKEPLKPSIPILPSEQKSEESSKLRSLIKSTTPSKKNEKEKTKKEKEKSLESLKDGKSDLKIPEVPVAPPKQIIKLDSPEVSPELLKKITKGETKELKYVLVKCDRCNKIIAFPVPKKKVLKSELPVVPISYIHGKGKERHCLTAHVDHDFDIRRRRVSDVVFEELE